MHAQVSPWPDSLVPASANAVGPLLENFWSDLAALPDLLKREEFILAERLTARLRDIVIDMMLAMNGIAYPAGTTHLNGYLSDSQRAVLERTLVAPSQTGETWLARVVALTVIYRWYAPQIAEKFGVQVPDALEAEVLAGLVARLPDWPTVIETE